MFKLRPIAVLVVGAGLLQACSTPPTRQELAMQAVLRVRHSSDQTAMTYYQLGKYHQEHGNLELAVTAYTHSIALDSRQLEPRNALAAVLAGQGRLDEAKSVLLQLVTDYPLVAHPFNNLGYVYFMQGNYSAAVTTLQHALEIDPGYERARNNLDSAQASVASHAGPASALAAVPDASSSTLVPPLRSEEAQIAPLVSELKREGVTAPDIPVQHAGQALVATAPSTAASAVLTRSPRVEIANGNGVIGMAKRARQMLGLSGIAVSRLTNDRPYTQQFTKIQYRIAFLREAIALQAALKGHAVMVLENKLSPGSDVRLLLGKDAFVHIASIDAMAITPHLAMNQTTN